MRTERELAEELYIRVMAADVVHDINENDIDPDMLGKEKRAVKIAKLARALAHAFVNSG